MGAAAGHQLAASRRAGWLLGCFAWAPHRAICTAISATMRDRERQGCAGSCRQIAPACSKRQSTTRVDECGRGWGPGVLHGQGVGPRCLEACNDLCARGTHRCGTARTADSRLLVSSRGNKRRLAGAAGDTRRQGDSASGQQKWRCHTEFEQGCRMF
jgi:hypothetical protein